MCLPLGKSWWAPPGFEPGTSRTLSENHTPRPKSQIRKCRLLSENKYFVNSMKKKFSLLSICKFSKIVSYVSWKKIWIWLINQFINPTKVCIFHSIQSIATYYTLFFFLLQIKHLQKFPVSRVWAVWLVTIFFPDFLVPKNAGQIVDEPHIGIENFVK